jgi:hypothetical protein
LDVAAALLPVKPELSTYMTYIVHQAYDAPAPLRQKAMVEPLAAQGEAVELGQVR